MANTKEIKNRIKSVHDTQKITNAMYLIASTKMQKAKGELDNTKPYFSALKEEIKRIFRHANGVSSQYFFPPSEKDELEGTYGILIITADKGLAGAYNQNVIKEAQKIIDEHKDVKLYVVGEYGRHYFDAHQIPIEHNFVYTAQNPTLGRAREICDVLLEDFNRHKLVKIFAVYTDFKGGLSGGEASSLRLIPFHRSHFYSDDQDADDPVFEFEPSIEEVLDNIMPSYISGFIYSALVDSFCSEQNARMTAMDAANQNAQELLEKLRLEYNYIRQGAITQEITEISSGAKALKQKREKQKGGN